MMRRNQGQRVLSLFAIILVVVTAAPIMYTLTTVDNDKYPNALCLDGSPAAFWFNKGSGSGVNKYIIHHQGGAWCTSPHDCVERAKTAQGSSDSWDKEVNCEYSKATPCTYDGGAHGMFSSDPVMNPLTYNWNKIYVGYCDGASFSGARKERASNGLHYKGYFILGAVYSTFFDKFGMGEAKEVIVSGTSAGGLSVFLHLDQIAELIKAKAPTNPRVVGVADAGLFMDLPSYKGEYTYTPLFKDIFEFQEISRSLGPDCKSKHTQDDAYKCFIGQYAVNYVKTPLFITNSLYDVYQHYRFMVLQCNPVPGATHGVCNKNHIKYMNNYRDTMVETIEKYLQTHPESGAWAVSCWSHPIKNHENFWDEIKAGQSKSVAATLKKTFNAWYEDEGNNSGDSKFIKIDGQWGSNQCDYETSFEESSKRRKLRLHAK